MSSSIELIEQLHAELALAKTEVKVLRQANLVRDQENDLLSQKIDLLEAGKRSAQRNLSCEISKLRVMEITQENSILKKKLEVKETEMAVMEDRFKEMAAALEEEKERVLSLEKALQSGNPHEMAEGLATELLRARQELLKKHVESTEKLMTEFRQILKMEKENEQLMQERDASRKREQIMKKQLDEMKAKLEMAQDKITEAENTAMKMINLIRVSAARIKDLRARERKALEEKEWIAEDLKDTKGRTMRMQKEMEDRKKEEERQMEKLRNRLEEIEMSCNCLFS
ncbi:unnamed protein product [Caenorhabditis sp. 36 PRJEB53466]|nr:unnamed protein product [Caenorhabditis sp. 36 PRJEB53466]